MTGLRQPDQDAALPAQDVARMRQVLIACSSLLAWAEASYGSEFTAAAAEAAEAAGPGRAPGALACQASLAIDCLDFSQAAGRTR